MSVSVVVVVVCGYRATTLSRAGRPCGGWWLVVAGKRLVVAGKRLVQSSRLLEVVVVVVVVRHQSDYIVKEDCLFVSLLNV